MTITGAAVARSFVVLQTRSAPPQRPLRRNVPSVQPSVPWRGLLAFCACVHICVLVLCAFKLHVQTNKTVRCLFAFYRFHTDFGPWSARQI